MPLHGARFTSLGVHDEQLTPEEYFAYITVDVSANLDFMAEARGLPRPSKKHPEADADDHDGVKAGFDGDRVDVEDADGVTTHPDFSDNPKVHALYEASQRFKPQGVHTCLCTWSRVGSSE